MRVFRFRLLDEPEVYHSMAETQPEAVTDICERFYCRPDQITDLTEVEKLTAKS